MEDNEAKPSVAIRFSPEEELKYLEGLKSQLIKLLYIIEGEQKGESDAELWLCGFMFDLCSANSLCDNRLTKVIVKIHGLYENNKYKTLEHSQIKRQIMESRGIVDGLIKDLHSNKGV